MKRIILSITLVIISLNFIYADEGMWLPVLIKSRIIDMQKNGSSLSAEDIYSVNKASIKDAIVQFGSGCTGELISDKGLLITNHHCGFSQIQSHSSIEHDYLKDGFLAKDYSEELPNKGLTVKFLVRMDDVTDKVLSNYIPGMSEKERIALVDKNSKEIVKENISGTNMNASIESFYYGNQYFIFIYKIYKDVRLVAAPPSSIGKFGGDTDNWVWPRHTGDFSIFRIYANKDNEPSEYSKDNIPYTPLKFFNISVKGIKEGDFTMVYGYPGRTQEYLYSDAVKYITDNSNPHKIKLRTLRLDIQNSEMSKSQEVRIKYAAKNANVANAWKKWQGEMTGLLNKNALDKKLKFENEFGKWSADKLQYKNLLTDFKSKYKELSPLAFVNDYNSEAIIVNELPKFAGSVIASIAKNKDEYVDKVRTIISELARLFYKDYYKPIDKASFIALLSEYDNNISSLYKPDYYNELKDRGATSELIADAIFDKSVYADSVKFFETLRSEDFKTRLESDPASLFYSTFNNHFNSKIKDKLASINDELNLLYRSYLKARMEYMNNNEFYPDANSTMRVAYGKIMGYSPADGVIYKYYSTLEGIMQKDNPKIYDYDIPQKMRDIYKAKDFGNWGFDGTVPVCFIATNHTSGGNSGSPVIDAKGNLIGINFDRVWEGTMSDVMFSSEICRNISLDIRYVLFVLDKVMDGKNLIDELKIVR